MNSKTHNLLFSDVRILTLHGTLGAILGIILLHPLTTVVFFLEFNDLLAAPSKDIWNFAIVRLQTATWFELVPMNAVFALIGASLAIVIGAYARALETQQRRASWLEKELDMDFSYLLAAGEGERLEFKSSLRWDLRKQESNKSLEKVIAKSIVGLMNHRGGSLAIGVDDSGHVLGIEADCQTLKHKNSDGFERAIMDLVRTTLGAHACTLVHCQFPVLDDRQVCHIVVEKADAPVYFQDGKVAKYFVRTGNSTRELDAREAQEHITQGYRVKN
ncbi:MAG: ATP-binding protein [Gammaproteobacteria bacterium]